MTIINFYSYKGGVGRTMLTAQIARLLAAMGKKVVVADFDFDAPGVPAVFGMKLSEVKSGLFEIAWNFAYDKDIVKDTWKTQEAYIKEIAKFLEDSFIHTKDITDNNDIADICLLPSGNINRDYWDAISNSRWAEFLTPHDNISNKEFSFTHFLTNSIKPALELLNIEYLLIDSRAGITNYGKVGQQISDIQAMIFCPNDEAKHMIEAGFFDEKEFQPKKPVFIVSRMPPELDKPTREAFDEIATLMRKKLNYTDEILKFHSDLQAHLNPEIRNINKQFTKEEQTKKKQAKKKLSDIVQMHEDILLIFAKLCPELISDRSDGEPLERVYAPWKTIFDYDFEMTYKNRMFEFRINSGEMRNPEDDARNVAFKVDTFIGLLNSFYATLYSQSGDKGTKIFASALKNAGLLCGSKFGEEIRKQWTIDGSFSSQPMDNIERWCKFDSDVGFGILSYNGDNKKGTVIVANPFILDSSVVGGAQFNIEFFTGYVKGVLTDLLGMGDVNVELYSTSSSGNFGNTIEYKIEIV